MAAFGLNGYFGEMALINDLARSASVIARRPTRILSLERWDLRQEIEKSPVMAMELLQMLSWRVRATEEIMIDMLGVLLPICANCKKIRGDDGSRTPIEQYTEAMIRVRNDFQKPFVMVKIPGFDPSLAQTFCQAGVPFFSTAERAMGTYAMVRRYQIWRGRRGKTKHVTSNPR